MLAGQRKDAFSSEEWVFEIKWDGYRAVAECSADETLLYSRNGISFQYKYPALYNELLKIDTQMVLDGEVVVLDDDNKPSFQLLQHYAENAHRPLVYYVFDLLQHKGEDLTSRTLIERKMLLQKILPQGEIIKYCDHVENDGEAFFKVMTDHNMEGMIAKKKSSIYMPGQRTDNWLKIKHQHTEEVVVAGYTAPRGGRKYFGALVLGTYKDGKLIYAGHTGTGFNDALLKELSAKFKPLETDVNPFGVKVPVNNKVTWLQPKYVANIRFTELTKENIMRHPVFQGLRIDKTTNDMKAATKKAPAKNVVKKAAAKQPKANATQAVKAETKDKAGNNDLKVTVDKIELQLTNINKIYFPDEGITKGEIIEYYSNIYPYIIPYLRNRPESLNRTPNGINKGNFFHKNMGDSAPEWAETASIFSESNGENIDYLICNNKATLLYMANLGCIEINPWNSNTASLDNPDYLILDLDPSEKNTYEHVIEVANVIQGIMKQIGAKAYPKTSGASGMHIYLPLAAKYSYDECRMFGELLANTTVRQLPNICTTERTISKRNHKLYVDFLQNRKGQTLACAYSARPKPGATVSMPLEWDEVKPGLHPSQFTIKNALDRIKKKGDIFKPVLGKGIDIRACLKKLEKMG